MVVNTDGMVVTGKKLEDKVYHRFSGYREELPRLVSGSNEERFARCSRWRCMVCSRRTSFAIVWMTRLLFYRDDRAEAYRRDTYFSVLLFFYGNQERYRKKKRSVNRKESFPMKETGFGFGC